MIIYPTFLDSKAAFDSVNREELMKIIRKLGIEEILILSIISFYLETASTDKVKRNQANLDR